MIGRSAACIRSTDEAFAKLPAGTLESLLKPENNTKLQNILKYHVVAGKVLLLTSSSFTPLKLWRGRK